MPGRLMLNELNDLHRDFFDLGRFVADTVANAIHVLRAPHAEALAAADIESDSPSERADRIVERCQRILLLYQPVAADFRQVTAILWAVREWEQVGNLALGIAKGTVDLAPWLVSAPEELSQMGAAAVGMVRAALDTCAGRNLATVQRVRRTNEELTDLIAVLMEWLTGAMKANPAAVEPGLGLFAVVQSLRRIADHATALADVVRMEDRDGGSSPNDWYPVRTEAARARHGLFGPRVSSVTAP